MGTPRWVEIEIDEILRETEKAIQVRRGEEIEWMPKSQIRDGEELGVGECDLVISVAEWLAEEKGWCG
jgi:hypothetical protein